MHVIQNSISNKKMEENIFYTKPSEKKNTIQFKNES